MNRIWISRDTSTSIREQLSSQLLFGIVTRRFAPSERLPSVRDLARRLKVHPNTVSAAYRDLAARGWVKRRAGSGVFVANVQPGTEIDAFTHAWIADGLRRGFSLDALGAAFEKARDASRAPSDSSQLLVVHADRDLARILAAEIEESIGGPVQCASIEEARETPNLAELQLLTTTSGSDAVARLRPEGHELIQLRSVEELLAGLKPPASSVLIAIVSRSETVLQWATLLVPAIGLPGSELIVRNPAQSGWQEGLAACDLVATDVVSARELPKKIHPIILRLVSDAFLHRARQRVTAQKP
jgi:DNA-binding transcriptional regulator YhcF (GntR family)